MSFKYSLLLAGSALLLAGPASAQSFGDWTVGAGQGYVEHTVQNGPGNEFTISCDEGATDTGENSSVSVRIKDRDPDKSSNFYVYLDGKSYQFQNVEKGGNLDCKSCSANFTAMWDHMKRAKQMLVTFSDGRSSPFSLKGVRQALKGEACKHGW